MKWGWAEKESPKQKKYSTYKRTSYELALWLLHFRALKLQRVIRYFKGMWWPFLIFHSNSLSFFFYFLLIPHQGHWRCWSPSQDLLGEKKECNLDRFSVHRTHHSLPHTHTKRKCSVSNQHDVFGLGEDTREILHWHKENMQTPHGKIAARTQPRTFLLCWEHLANLASWLNVPVFVLTTPNPSNIYCSI